MRIIKVEYLSDYKLKLTFGDRKIKMVDLAEKISDAKGIFRPLKDLDYFKQVSLDDCQLSICWPNGADICPDVLYSMGKSLKTENKIKKTKKSIKIRCRRKKQSA